MIISGTSRSDWRGCARRILREEGDDSARLVDITGFAADDIRLAFRIMRGLALMTRCENFFYHASINPRVHELLTERQWAQAVDILGRHLGLAGQPRFVVERVQDGRIHRQVVWSRIDTDRMKAIPDGDDYPKHMDAAREIEERFGLERTVRQWRRRRPQGAAAA